MHRPGRGAAVPTASKGGRDQSVCPSPELDGTASWRVWRREFWVAVQLRRTRRAFVYRLRIGTGNPRLLRNAFSVLRPPMEPNLRGLCRLQRAVRQSGRGLDAAWKRISTSQNLFVPPTTVDLGATRTEAFTGSMTQRWDGSLRLRAGALVTPWTLAYGTAGGAVGSVCSSFSYTALLTSPGTFVPGTPGMVPPITSSVAPPPMAVAVPPEFSYRVSPRLPPARTVGAKRELVIRWGREWKQQSPSDLTQS